MANVTFEEETQQTRYTRPVREPKGLYKLVIGWKLAKDEGQAKIVLIMVALAALAIAIVYPMLIL